MPPYLTNLEKAITTVLEANLQISWTSVFDAYYEITHFRKSLDMRFEVLLAFERAMGKYPAVGESPSSLFANHVTNIREEYFKSHVAGMAKIINIRISRPCGCCYETYQERLRYEMGFMDDELQPQAPCPGYEQAYISKPKKSKRYIRKGVKLNSRKNLNGKRVAFDIYGPSTSARSM